MDAQKICNQVEKLLSGNGPSSISISCDDNNTFNTVVIVNDRLTFFSKYTVPDGTTHSDTEIIFSICQPLIKAAQTFTHGVVFGFLPPVWYTYRSQSISYEEGQSIDNYVKYGIDPGGFIHALLCNDFVGAAGLADVHNFMNLGAWAAYLYNEIPRGCWGSKKIVKEWMEKKSAAK